MLPFLASSDDEERSQRRHQVDRCLPGLGHIVGRRVGLQRDARRYLQIAAGCVPLREKEIEVIRIAGCECERIKIDVAVDFAMNAAKVHRQLLIDEHPNVIVPREAKVLSRLVCKRRVDLIRERVIMAGPLVPAKSAIDREERGTGIRKNPGSPFIQGYGVIIPQVYASRIVIPLVEPCLAMHRIGRAVSRAPRVLRRAVDAEGRFDDSGLIAADDVLKIRVTRKPASGSAIIMKVPNRPGKRDRVGANRQAKTSRGCAEQSQKCCAFHKGIVLFFDFVTPFNDCINPARNCRHFKGSRIYQHPLGHLNLAPPRLW
jgi:hypothetical protein